MKIIFTEEDAREAVVKILLNKGLERAKLIERMMRLETAHFKSKQYAETGSAGMEGGAWGASVRPYIGKKYRTVGFKDNHPKERGTADTIQFIVWDSVYHFCLFLSDYIDRHDGNYARWNSTSSARQILYRVRVNSIRNRFL